MALTKKDFEAIARIFADHKQAEPLLDLLRQSLARDMARFCYSQNPNFDKQRFLDASKVEE